MRISDWSSDVCSSDLLTAEEDQANSITLGAVSMDTDVVIGAGIFALTGQVAEIAGPLLPFAFPAAAGMTGFSAHSCLKMSNAYPSTLATRKMEPTIGRAMCREKVWT